MDLLGSVLELRYRDTGILMARKKSSHLPVCLFRGVPKASCHDYSEIRLLRNSWTKHRFHPALVQRSISSFPLPSQPPPTFPLALSSPAPTVLTQAAHHYLSFFFGRN